LSLRLDSPHLLGWSTSIGTEGADASVELALDTGNSNHEELIEICSEDRGKFDPIQKWLRGLFNFEKDATVEFEPAQLAVDEHRRLERRQCGGVLLGDSAICFACAFVPPSVPRGGTATAGPFFFHLCHVNASIRHASVAPDWLTNLSTVQRPPR
jgi:hypothetical protein